MTQTYLNLGQSNPVNSTYTVTAIAASTPSTTFTQYTTSVAHNFVVGESVTFAGSSIGGYNGTFTVVSLPSTITIVVLNSTTGSPTLTAATAVGVSQTIVYTVPALTSAVISSIVVCNQGTTGTYSIAWQVGGATLTAAQYLIYNATLNTNDTITMAQGLSLATTDVISVWASTTNFSFNISGVQNT